MIRIDTVIDDGDRDTLAFGQSPRRHHIGMFFDVDTIYPGFVQVPLFWKHLPSTYGMHQFGVTEFDILFSQKSCGDTEHGPPGIIRGRNKVGIPGITDFSFNQKVEVAKQFSAGMRRDIIIKFDEQILGIDDWLLSLRTTKDTPGKLDL